MGDGCYATTGVCATAKAIGVVIAVVDDGRIHAVAQVLQVALERGARDLQLSLQGLKRHPAARLDQQLDPVKAFSAVHGLAYLRLMT